MNTSAAASQLLYRLAGTDPALAPAIIVALHGTGADAMQLDGWAAAAQDAAWVLPQAARSCNPVLGGGNRWGAYGGYRWYFDVDGGRAEPASFGDSLAQVDLFLQDVRTGAPDTPLYLVGYQQGASLALAAALVAPEMVHAVVAVAGFLPAVPGWQLPNSSVNGLPVMLVAEPDQPADYTVRHLTERGAHVDVSWAPGVSYDPARAVDRVAAAINKYMGTGCT